MLQNTVIEGKSKTYLASVMFLIAFMALLFSPLPAYAEETHDISSGPVELTSASCGDNCQGHIITGQSISSDGLGANVIKVTSGKHNITLQNVTIDATYNGQSLEGCAFYIAAGASVDLTLSGTNTLTSSATNAGLCVPNGAALTITKASDGSSLDAKSVSRGAGIGAFGTNGSAGTITIDGGTITATGGSACAGIGGSYGGGAGTIHITGGTVTATGGTGETGVYPWGGAGIGCGSGGTDGIINITGGTVTATGGTAETAGYCGSGIGCDGATTSSAKKVDITISGGNVTAKGGVYSYNDDGQVVRSQGSGISFGTGSLSSGGNAKLVLEANSITSSTRGDSDDFNAIVWFDQNTCQVYGDAIASDHFVISSIDQELTIPANCSLTLPKESSWNSAGYIDGRGKIINYDKLTFTAPASLSSGNRLTKYVSMVESDITANAAQTYTGGDLFSKLITIASTHTDANTGEVYSVDSTTHWTCTVKNAGGETIANNQIIDVGTYTVTYEYYDESAPIVKTVQVVPKPLDASMITVDRTNDLTYTGNPIEPTITVKNNNTPLTEGTDYTITGYSDNTNVGDGTVTIEAVAGGNYTGSASKTFTITPASIKTAIATATLDDAVYNAQEKTPTVIVILDGRELTQGTDYTVTYDKNLTDAGAITATITAITGNYKDTVTKGPTFEIQQKPLEITNATVRGREYNGTSTVSLSIDYTDLAGVEQNDGAGSVLVENESLTGTLLASGTDEESADVGSYSKIRIDDLTLTGERASNYTVNLPQIVSLATPVEITTANPQAPQLSGSSKESTSQANTFIYTVTVDDPLDFVTYEYRIDGGSWQDENVFETLVPGSTHTFEARAKADLPNVNEGAIGSLSDTIAKLTQKAPDNFTLEFSANDDGTYTATIPTQPNAEYSFDNVNWSDSNTKKDCQGGQTYTGYIRFKETETHEASDVKSDTQTAPTAKVATPVISPDGRSFISSQQITISCATEGATIYYTTDGSDPTTASTKYTEAFTINETTTVKAMAAMESTTNSDIASAIFTKSDGADLNFRVTLKEITKDTAEEDVVSDGLAATSYNTIESITKQLSNILTESGEFNYLNIAYYDMTIEMRTESGGWETATADNFPEKGATIVLPYPTDTAKDTHSFGVAHMFSESSTRLGYEAGEVEQPAVTETDDGIQVTVKGASPIAIAYAASTDNNNGSNGSGSGTTGSSDNNGSGTTDGTGSSTDGSGSSTDGTSDGSGSGSTTASDILSAIKTGDSFNILIWIIVAAVSATAVIFLVRRRHS